MKYLIVVVFAFFIALTIPGIANAQQPTPFTSPIEFILGDNALSATLAGAISSQSAIPIIVEQKDVTKPDQGPDEAMAIFSKRPADHLTWTNFMAYFVQHAVTIGVPANTIMLILLLPFLASIVAFLRHVIGLPSLEMLVPVALSITLLATGLTAGLFLLGTILLGSTVARFALKQIRIMQLPKMALSVWVVALFVLAALTISAQVGILTVRQLSIFPILLLILLSERVVTLQLQRSMVETFSITFVTLSLGILGYLLLSSTVLRTYVLLYPEVIFVLVPVNLAIGRYFGLRVTEYFRFRPLQENGNK